MHAPVGDPFANGSIHPLSGTDVIQTEHQEFCGNLWNIAQRQGMKEQRNYVLQFLDELWL